MKLNEIQEFELNSFYGTYLRTHKPNVGLTDTLAIECDVFLEFLSHIPMNKWHYKYEPDKWTISEVCTHIIDTERIFAYRALRISRGDKTPLPGFNQNEYVPYYTKRTIEEIKDEFLAVRNATIALFNQLTSKQLKYEGIVGNTKATVGGIGFTISGHEKHHLNIIKERYL